VNLPIKLTHSLTPTCSASITLLLQFLTTLYVRMRGRGVKKGRHSRLFYFILIMLQYALVEEGNTTIPVLVNDSDQDNNSLSLVSLTQPPSSQGAVSIDGTNVIFTPSALFPSGTTSFQYNVTDGRGGYTTATVTVTGTLIFLSLFFILYIFYLFIYSLVCLFVVCNSTRQCPSVCSLNCNDHGACNLTNADCICDLGWTGSNCTTCDTNYFGTNCSCMPPSPLPFPPPYSSY
jgi:hypothetical protein